MATAGFDQRRVKEAINPGTDRLKPAQARSACDLLFRQLPVDDGISLGKLAIELLFGCHDDLKIGKLLS
jgi:hypothetical protein